MKKTSFVIFLGLFLVIAFMPVVFADQLPSYKTICSHLGDIPGWKSDKCSGMNLSSSPMGNIVSANREYSKGDKEINVSVISGMQAIAGWAPFAGNLNMETNESLVKTLDISGYRAGINYHKQEKAGSITICLEQKNSQCEAIFGISFSNMNWEDASELVKNFDLKEIESIFK